MFYSPAFAIQNQNVRMSLKKKEKKKKKADTHSLPGVHATNNVNRDPSGMLVMMMWGQVFVLCLLAIKALYYNALIANGHNADTCPQQTKVFCLFVLNFKL